MTIAFQSNFDLGKKGIVPGNMNEKELLGQRGFHLDVDRIPGEAIKPRVSGMITHAMCVRAEAIVNPGDLVDWDVGSTYGPGMATGGVSAGDGDAVVDPYLDGPLAVGDVYWAIVRGPILMAFTTGTTLLVGDPLERGADGRVVVQSSGVKIATVLQGLDASADNDTLFRVFFDPPTF